MENLFSYVENFQLTEENLILLMVMFATVLIVVVIFLIVFGSKSLVRNRLCFLNQGTKSSAYDLIS